MCLASANLRVAEIILCAFEVLQQLLCNVCFVCSREAQIPLNVIVEVASFSVKTAILKLTVFLYLFLCFLCECAFRGRQPGFVVTVLFISVPLDSRGVLQFSWDIRFYCCLLCRSFNSSAHF